MKAEKSSFPCRAATLNQALVGRKTNTFSVFSNSSIFLLIGFKFEGTSPGNSAENYSAAVTDRYIDGPSYSSFLPGMFFSCYETRAHTMNLTTESHK